MAKRTSRKQTANQREYAKQVNRIKQAIRRAEKRGYMFDEIIVPQTPKRVTKKSIQTLKEITPEKLYAQAHFLDTATGEVLSGQEGRKLERQRSAEKAKQTRNKKKNQNKHPYSVYEGEEYSGFAETVIMRYKTHIRHFNDLAYYKLNSWLDSLIAKFGVEDVAEMLEVGAQNGLIVTYQIVYSQDKLIQYISDMLDYLPEVGDMMKEDILDAFEQMEDWEGPV